MFNNIGRKIKTVAVVGSVLGIFVSVVAGIALVVQDEDTVLSGILVIVLGSLSSWLGAFFTYGFGQLIENSDILVENSYLLGENSDDLVDQGDQIITAINNHNDDAQQ